MDPSSANNKLYPFNLIYKKVGFYLPHRIKMCLLVKHVKYDINLKELVLLQILEFHKVHMLNRKKGDDFLSAYSMFGVYMHYPI